MKKNHLPIAVLGGTALLAAAVAVRADVVPATLFQDHAVLQAGKPVPVWGRAESGEKVIVRFAGQNVATTTGAEGVWKVTLAPLKVSAKPAELTISGRNTVTLKDIVVGEVWLCAGQSNMEFRLNQAANAEKEIATANFPLIRQFDVRNAVANEPLPTLAGKWVVSSPETAGAFSAVGFFFARDLYEELGVPVGIINSSWGGTDIEAWMSAESISHEPALTFVASNWQKRLDDYPTLKAKFDAHEAEEVRRAAEAKASGKPYKKRWQATPPNPDGSPDQNKPSNLFNAMVHPLLPVALAGIAWYQGENNASRAAEYRQLFPRLISGWREVLGQGDLPFYWVQLPNFGGYGPGQIAALRESQTAALSLPATGQAVTIDVGETRDIHPKNKLDVGHRLARLALQKPYGRKVITSGPLFAGAKFSGGTATATFNETGGRLTQKGPALTGFELAGDDKKFHPAEARASGDTVTVRSDAVPRPVALRYAWQNDPRASLFGQSGLPAPPFRTDTW